MLVRMMVPTESEPAMTFEKVHPGTTLCGMSDLLPFYTQEGISYQAGKSLFSS